MIFLSGINDVVVAFTKVPDFAMKTWNVIRLQIIGFYAFRLPPPPTIMAAGEGPLRSSTLLVRSHTPLPLLVQVSPWLPSNRTESHGEEILPYNYWFSFLWNSHHYIKYYLGKYCLNKLIYIPRSLLKYSLPNANCRKCKLTVSLKVTSDYVTSVTYSLPLTFFRFWLA